VKGSKDAAKECRGFQLAHSAHPSTLMMNLMMELNLWLHHLHAFYLIKAAAMVGPSNSFCGCDGDQTTGHYTHL